MLIESRRRTTKHTQAEVRLCPARERYNLAEHTLDQPSTRPSVLLGNIAGFSASLAMVHIVTLTHISLNPIPFVPTRFAAFTTPKHMLLSNSDAIVLVTKL